MEDRSQDLLVKCNQYQQGCQWQGGIGELEVHTSKECLFQLCSCKYAKIGCNHTTSRQELSKHQDDDKQHLQLAMDTILKLEDKVVRIQSSTASKEEALTYSFKMYNFSKYKSNDETFFSKPYYTSPNGYKFCIQVYANGYKEGKGTHVSAFVCLMKGANDDSLAWPFTGNITIGLFDQVGDNDDSDRDWELAPFSANDEDVSGRVMVGQRQERGLGKSKFIAHADLGYNADKKCQYLKDDTLVFGVAIVDLPDPEDGKIWLLTKMYN